MAMHTRLGDHSFELDSNRWPCFPPGARVTMTDLPCANDPLGSRLTARVPVVGLIFHLQESDEKGAMRELASALDFHLARWLRHPMRAGRHDRGWPKVAA